MKRVVAFAVLISFVAIPAAHAEERRFTPRTSVSFSPAAMPAPLVAPRLTSKASIDHAIATVASSRTASLVRRRTVLKKAWFWVLVGGAATALVIVAANSGGSDGGIY